MGEDLNKEQGKQGERKGKVDNRQKKLRSLLSKVKKKVTFPTKSRKKCSSNI